MALANAANSALGPLGTSGASMTVFAGAVGTTPTLVALPTPALTALTAGTYRLKITNGAASERLAWQTVAHGGAAPTFNANFAAAAGVIILAGATEYVNLVANRDLYLVGSAAGVDYCVSVEMVG